MEQRLIAIWKYDITPYYLAGEIESFTKGGLVCIKGYGGFCFTPVKIFPYDEGFIVKNKLEDSRLTKEAKQAADSLVK
jgi:hypothetical protein